MGQAKHLEVEVSTVTIGFGKVVLNGVKARSTDEPEIVAQFDKVDVSLSWRGRARRIQVHGGAVSLPANPWPALRRLREHAPTSDRTATGASREPVPFELTDAVVKVGGEVVCRGASVEREDEVVRLRVVEVDKFPLPRLTASEENNAPSGRFVSASLLGVGLNGSRLHSVSADRIHVSSPAPAPRDGPAAAPPSGAPADEFSGVVSPSILRAAVRETMKGVAPRIDDDLEIRIARLEVEVGLGGDVLQLAGRFRANKRADVLSLELASLNLPRPDATPLELRGDLPLSGGELAVTMSGGPIPLSSLGVREGDVGLVDVGASSVSGSATFRLDEVGRSLTFDVDVAIDGANVEHKRLASHRISNVAVGVAARGLFEEPMALRLDRANVRLGALEVNAAGAVARHDGAFRIEASFFTPVTACSRLLERMPTGLFPTLEGARMTGTLAMNGRVELLTSKLDDLVLETRIDHRCKFVAMPAALDADKFRRPFTLLLSAGDDKKDARPGEEKELRVGPGTENWVGLDDISPYMQVAVLTTEDGSFYKHGGFNKNAIRQSLISNLKAGRFVRGASTITMQLAKNLYLAREKTLSRKLQEVVLTTYLEDTFSKEELMELYLNVIEFGPDVYGIGPAAEHYFGRAPSELNLMESMFLASLLPNPKSGHRAFERGELSEGGHNHLKALLRAAFKTKKISSVELDEGSAEVVTFVRKEGARPQPRSRVRRSMRVDGEPGDADFVDPAPVESGD